MVELAFTLRFPEGWSEDERSVAPGRRFVFSPGGPASNVKAIASIAAVPRQGIRPDELLDRAVGSPAESHDAADGHPYRLWRREAERLELAGMDSVVVHDLFRPDGATHPALQQRLLVTFFPDGSDTTVQFTLSSPDLLAFDDFLTDGLAIAATLHLTERASA